MLHRHVTCVAVDKMHCQRFDWHTGVHMLRARAHTHTHTHTHTRTHTHTHTQCCKRIQQKSVARDWPHLHVAANAKDLVATMRRQASSFNLFHNLRLYISDSLAKTCLKASSRNAHLDFHHDIVTSISKSNRSKGVEDTEDSISSCVAIQVVLSPRLFASMTRHTNSNGGIADRHNCRGK